MSTFRFTGDQPHVFVDIPDPDGNGTWVAEPGATIDLEVKQVGEGDEAVTVRKNGLPIPDRLVPVAKSTVATKAAAKTKE